MPSDSGKPLSRTGRIRGRRFGSELQDRIAEAASSTRAGWGSLVTLLFIIIASLLTIWSREQPLVAVGRTMDDTRLVRVPFSVEDKTATNQRREEARARTPRVYIADMAVLEEIRNSLENLPKTISAVESLEQVEATIRDQFALTPEALAALKAQTADERSQQMWFTMVRDIFNQMRRRPLLDEQTWQKSSLEGLHTEIALVLPEQTIRVFRGEVVNTGDQEKLREAAAIMARDSGFSGVLRQVVVSRLSHAPVKATFRYDEGATAAAQKVAAEAVRPVFTTSTVGQVIFGRGDVLTSSQFDLYREEMRHFFSDSQSWQIWLRRAGLVAGVGAIALAIAGYTTLFVPRVRRNPARMTGMAGLLFVALVAACVGTAANPAWAAATVTLPTVFLAIILVIAYEQRVALAYAVLHGMLVCIALDQGVGVMATIITGVGAAVWHLKDIRDRSTLLRMSMVVGVALAFATALVSLINRPITVSVVRETVLDSALVGGGGLLIGAIALFILPTIERSFDITTGLTLIELRDPKHPLLRELQQRAPGTYTHSLNVAAISEAAADAIGADSLLAYVGATYHDVGKMTKPEYFVENQMGGANKHDKLTPAMSLLVVVGHVKDGVELARQYKLPRAIQHFVESHHGTTLVEYFYHRAKQQAMAKAQREDDDAEPEDMHVPDEFEYRYPGPKPRTREAAILMMADACESASRSLADPTPSRIEGLVRAIADKRLRDGQFEECEITLRDLNLIAESVSRSLTSIHHSRIAYPDGKTITSEPKPDTKPAEPKLVDTSKTGPAIEKRA